MKKLSQRSLSLSLSLCTFSAICCLFLAGCEKDKFAEIAPQTRLASADDLLGNLYLVEIKDDPSIEETTEQIIKAVTESPTLDQTGVSPRVESVYRCMLVIAVRLTEQQAEQLKTDPKIKAVELNYEVSLVEDEVSTTSTSSSEFHHWGLDSIGWQSGVHTGTGKRVIIIDTGISPHEDLPTPIYSKSFVANIPSTLDTYGHGTKIAGLIGALDNEIGVVGVAPGVSIVNLKIFKDNGKSDYNTLLRAINWVCIYGRSGDVVNLSLGMKADSLPTYTILEDRIVKMGQNGILFSIAAGNEKLPESPRANAGIMMPARLNGENIYTISSYKVQNDVAQLQDISFYGNPPIDYTCPGKDLRSTKNDGSYGAQSGTSAAAAIMSGILVVKGNNFATRGTISVTNDPDGIADIKAALVGY